jgi:hypothetical protein
MYRIPTCPRASTESPAVKEWSSITVQQKIPWEGEFTFVETEILEPLDIEDAKANWSKNSEYQS